MAGETIQSSAICLAVRPWSRTSHVVTWLTPDGCRTTLVKGAVRPKSAFLGQYDLNYTCEIVYYARSRGDLHALREAAPVARRDGLRDDFRALLLAEYFRRLVAAFAPAGSESADWFAALSAALDALAASRSGAAVDPLASLLAFELKVLDLAGLLPDFGAADGELVLRGERKIPVSPEVVACLRDPASEKNAKVLIDAARVIGVYYSLHVDVASEVRREVLKLISNNRKRITG